MINNINFRRITVITGHYGSGKTNLAVNLALCLKALGKKCAVADLDIVNPYFRAADYSGLFAGKGIDVLVSDYANSNLDIPSLTLSLNRAVTDDTHLIIDVGGDDAGAVALGRYGDLLSAEKDLDMLYVINSYRYLTKEPEDALILLREIEAASGLSCTGIVNNSNLGRLTDKTVIEESLSYAQRVSELSGVPVKFTAVRRDICESVTIPDKFLVDIYVKNIWDK